MNKNNGCAEAAVIGLIEFDDVFVQCMLVAFNNIKPTVGTTFIFGFPIARIAKV